MVNAIGRELLNEVEDRIVEEAVRVSLAMADRLTADGGLVYGDVELKTDAEFMLWYLDLRNRNVLRFLRTVAPEFAGKQDARFNRISERQLEQA